MKVCILAAGKGSRMGFLSQMAHKALLPLGNQAVISHILAQFDPDHEFVIALGHQGEQIQDFLLMVHPQLKLTFVQVQNFDGPGSGPGQSLFECRHLLQEPFFFSACDTLITSPLPAHQGDWIGVLPVEDPQNWCSAATDAQNRVTRLQYKEPTKNRLAFSGIARVEDWQTFWRGLSGNQELLGGELQVNNGLESLIPGGLQAFSLGWRDTGNLDAYIIALDEYPKNYTFLGKTTDITYRYQDQVIKYFANPATSRDRYQRAFSYPGVFCEVLGQRGGFYSYLFTPGELLSANLNYKTCLKTLEWAEQNLWRNKEPDSNYHQAVEAFYVNKTLQRLQKYLDQYNPQGEVAIKINDLDCQPVGDLLASLKAELLEKSLPSSFHGDFHSDNILLTANGFRLIDWRENFGHSFDLGDRYYDLSKFLHTLEFSVAAMDAADFDLSWHSKQSLCLDHGCKFHQTDALEAFWLFVQTQNYQQRQIRLINAIIYINMAPLYEKKLADYLYYFGRYQLQKIQEQTHG